MHPFDRRERLGKGGKNQTNFAGSEEYEGKKQDWTGILEGELGKACEIQAETGGLGCRSRSCNARFGVYVPSALARIIHER